MRFLTAVRAEFARLTSTRLGTTALIALMTIPIFYGGLYLWGNANPQGNLGKVPAALVVDDTGVTVNGTHENYGRETADALKKSGSFGWVEVSSASAAHAGVVSGKYDFAFEFPASFSKNLASSGGTSPTSAQLKLITDDTNSYLSSTLATQAATTVKDQITAELGTTASRELLDGVAQLRSGLSDAADAAGQLATGAQTADSGAASLASGTAQVSAGASTLDSGLATLNAQTRALPSSTATLSSGASQVSAGIGQVNSLAQQTRSDTAAAFQGSDVPPAEQQKILAELDALSSSTSATSTLGSGASQVAAGSAKLAAQAPALAAGVASSAAGASTLASGASSSATGAAQLKSGTSTLSSGASELQSSLVKGVADAPATTAAQRAASAKAIASPVAVKRTAITQAADYGAGLAPFFISLAAWIGIYALFLLVRPLSRRALTAGRSALSTAMAGWAVPAVLGVVQMIALYVVVTGPLHLAVANPVALVAFMALVAATYAAIVLALNVWLGSVGQFLGLVLMVIQLVTAGGTFPWQTLPGPLAALHQALPMSHAVDGIRQLMYGGSGATFSQALLILVCWLLAALAISALGARKQSGFRTLRELRPSPIGS